MIQAIPNPDYISIASLLVAIVSFIASLVSAAIANGARKDAKRIADTAHDEWAQQKWFDLYFSANSAYDLMEKLQADSIVQRSGTINILGGNYQDRANEVIRQFRVILAMAMVFPKCAPIDTLCAATSGFVDDPREMLSKQRLKNLRLAVCVKSTAVRVRSHAIHPSEEPYA
jgi:hypothetical protein